MKNLYARYSTYAFRIGILAICTLPFIAYLTYINFIDIEPLVGVVLSAAFSLGSSIYFKKVSEQLPEDSTNFSSKDFSINEFNFQPDASFYSRLYLVSNEGQQQYVIEPTTRKPLSRYLTFFSIISSGWVIPITYDVMTRDRSRVFSFIIKNEWKQFRITILNEKDEVIAFYKQPLLKSPLKNNGVLFLLHQDTWRIIKAKNISGDIDIHDNDNRLTASYRYGMFPYTLHPAFQALPINIHIKLGSHVLEDERKAYLAIFYFWLNGR